MNGINKAKYANLLFFSVVLISMAANVFVSLLSVNGIKISILMNLLVSQGIIILPGLVAFLFISKDEESINPYKKIKISSVLLLILFTWFLTPLISAINVFSQFFTSNEVLSISDDVLSLPIGLMVFIIGIFGPFCEEFVFRAVIYRALSEESGRLIASGLISALFFGLMHMNLNQFCYAFVLGIIFALINETLESTWPSFICHATINTQNVLLLYIANKLITMYGGQNISGITEEGLVNSKITVLIMFMVLTFISVFTTVIAALLFLAICSIEGKLNKLKQIFAKQTHEHKEKILYLTGIIGIVICVFVMFLLEPILKIMQN